ncbi:MAG: hypothetical protein J1E84_05900 [Muribaculaceae bacterium]|nr:hypothetical protein [Muribaculaceae bacterium]
MKRFNNIIATALIGVACLSGTVKAVAQEQFTRGLEQISFVPKGQWIAGVSVDYSQDHADNYQFLIVENLSNDSYSFKVSPMLMYCFKDNLAGGVKFAYQRSMLDMANANVIIDSETSYDVDHLYSLRQNYYGTAAMRYYISLGNSSRFGFFSEVDLKFGGGQSKLVNGSGDSLTGTYERNFNVGVGLTPGIMMFLNNYSALEVSVGVLGFDYTHTKSITDQVYIANRRSQSANFKVNLFSVSFGVAFYL